MLYLSCVILKHTGEEGLREEETRDPIVGRRALIDPLLHEF